MSADVAVVGLGPAGRALAHRLLARGASVLAVDPHPDRVWRPTYAGWRDQLPAWLPAPVVGARARRVDLVAQGRHDLGREYVVCDNAALHAACDLTGARVEARLVADAELPTLAGVVVDCRGSRPVGTAAGGPAQTAYGLPLEPDAAAPLLGGADAVLMDWRPYDGRPAWGRERATFCYVVPLPDGRVLAEETCLAGDPALAQPVLRRRLLTRLAAAGITTPPHAEPERVHIPLLPSPRPGHRFGAAGAQLNPISGYSVFASLAQADAVADALLAGRSMPGDDPSPIRLAALEAVLRLGGDDTVALFEGFGRLGAADRRAVLDPAADTAALLRAMARQWAGMGWRRGALVAATAGGLPRVVRGRR